jgi:acyl-CoA synthetase (AMP-forming)/AMP-acid ligase II
LHAGGGATVAVAHAAPKHVEFAGGPGNLTPGMNTILTRLSAELIRKYEAEGFWGKDTIYALARGHAERAPESFAVRDRFRRLTYRELVAAADALAADFERHGVRAGQRIGVWLPSRIESVVAVLACSKIGAVCCPSLHRDHTVGEVVELMQRTRAVAFIWQDGYGADADKRDFIAALKDAPTVKQVYRLAPVAENQPPPFPDIAPAGPHDSATKTDPNTVVYLAFTSGTTGKPKGVMHSDNTILANARQLAKDWHIADDAVIYALSPLSHNLSFVGAQVISLAVGAELVVYDLPRSGSLADRIVETGTSFLVGVPPNAIDLLAEMQRRGLKGLGRLRGFRISGSAVPSEVVAGLIRQGIQPQSGYGMTENCSHQYTLPGDDPKLIIETSGKTCPGYELKIFKADDPDTEAAPDEVGQMGGRGASLMLGYFDDQAATEDAFNKSGWFMTGDLGTIDRNGYLRIAGRAKDIIIRGGHNIHPAHIEELATRHPAVRRAAAVPVKDHRLGEKVCLAVVFGDGKSATPEELLSHLDAAGLSKFDMPEFYLRLDEIPLTPNGKMLKRAIVDWIKDGKVTPQPVRFEAKRATG